MALPRCSFVGDFAPYGKSSQIRTPNQVGNAWFSHVAILIPFTKTPKKKIPRIVLSWCFQSPKKTKRRKWKGIIHHFPIISPMFSVIFLGKKTQNFRFVFDVALLRFLSGRRLRTGGSGGSADVDSHIRRSRKIACVSSRFQSVPIGSNSSSGSGVEGEWGELEKGSQLSEALKTQNLVAYVMVCRSTYTITHMTLYYCAYNVIIYCINIQWHAIKHMYI